MSVRLREDNYISALFPKKNNYLSLTRKAFMYTGKLLIHEVLFSLRKALLQILFIMVGYNFAANPPNFIIIFMDDLGYNDISVNGAPHIQTPRLDQMAAEGVRFTNFYSAANVCTPSRAALLTGCYPVRTGTNIVLGSGAVVGLNPNLITIADLLKRKSYATAAIGKWHLGSKPRFLPTAQGFDTYFGVPYSNDMTPAHLVRDTSVVEFPIDQGLLTKRYTDESIAFIRKKASDRHPFFLYLAHTMPHVPLYVSKGFNTNPSCSKVGADKACGLYADVVEEVDYNIGRLMDSIKAFGIDSTTLVIFTSDNGPWLSKNIDGGSADPLRGGKFGTYEGGHREPAIMRWPGKIPKGIVQPSVVTTIDLLPTLAAIADIPLPFGTVVAGKPYKIDGINVLDKITGKSFADRATPFFYQQANDVGIEAVRLGKWKLLTGNLYDLEKDISETKNVASANSKIKDSLDKIRQNFINAVQNEKWEQGTQSTTVPVAGCTDSRASNFNPNAMRDNGSCIVVRGCTDPGSGNYNKNAMIDDGSCSGSTNTKMNRSPKTNSMPFALNIEYRGDGTKIIQSTIPVSLTVYSLDGQKVYLVCKETKMQHQLPRLPQGVFLLYAQNHDLNAGSVVKMR